METDKYDTNNVFAKIIRGELPTTKIYEDHDVLCFEDMHKVADIHWLFVPKGEYICFDDFMSKAGESEVASFFKTIKDVATKHGLDKNGYRLVVNNGRAVGQSVFHFHVHLLSGGDLKHIL